MRFRVQLDLFSGPLDLLWYLVRKHELDILDIPIAAVTEQYLEMLAVLEQIDVNAVGDFLEVATRLMEIKSKLMLPRHEEVETEEAIEDPRQDMVKRLLEYKKYKDAASMLEHRSYEWQQRYARRGDDLPTTRLAPDQQPIQEVELWDLVSAFSRVIRDNAAATPSAIRYDDTPIEVHIDRIRKRLAAEQRVAFTSLFERESDEAAYMKSQLVGIFLAILELIRHHHVQVEQAGLFDEIWIVASDAELKAEQPRLHLSDPSHDAA
ncbi:MAG: segregation/condensation protein A [Planctomycetota bacterium]